ncbi:MAG TPA: hypothetical protein VMR75_01445 [Candidatus Saccharimonadales bacterium]|nr:hypothetical protein [Candidatus Saccharimonadales bacterium]
MQNLRDQKGFSILDGILIVIALAAIGVAGYFAYQAHINRPKVATVSKSSQPKTTSKTAPSALATNVLQIPELGVQMTLPSGLSKSDVYYVADATPSTSQDTNGRTFHSLGYVVLSTHSLVAQEPNCAPTLIGGQYTGLQGLITFSKSQDNGQNYNFMSPDTHYKQVGNFYMSIGDHQSVCSSTQNTTLEQNQYSLFLQAYNTITPIN